MKLKNYLTASLLTIFVLFTGCSKEIDEYNKPAMYWYSKIVEQISNGDLDRADEYYSSLQGEHISSPLLPEATMILAIAHMYFEEYLLSEHFLDEYVKRYATANEKEEAEFLKIRAKYMALPNPRRDQALIDEAIESGEKFKKDYPSSMYTEVVNTMLTRLYLAQAVLNETIASLYDRIDKPKSAEYYRAIKPKPWIVWEDIDRANTWWLREWFEGDGTSSWYEFMIPDTESVVSRNSVKDDAEVLKEENTSTASVKEQSTQLTKTTEEVAKVVEKEVIAEKAIEDDSSWYDFMNPFSESTEEVAKVQETKVVEKEVIAEKAIEDDSSWYDFMNPFSESTEEVAKVQETKVVEKEVTAEKVIEDDSSWYDFMNPFSSN